MTGNMRSLAGARSKLQNLLKLQKLLAVVWQRTLANKALHRSAPLNACFFDAAKA